MRVTHSHPYGSITKIVSPNTGILLTKNGDYFAAFPHPQSRYQGWFVHVNDTLIKIIDTIHLSSEEPREVQNLFSHINRVHTDITETFFLPDSHTLLYAISEKRTIQFSFDIRPAYSSPDVGRTHIHYHDKNTYVLEYRYQNEQPLFIALYADSTEYIPIDKWEEVYYPLDEQRQSYPSKRYVYNGIALTAKRVCIGIGFTRDEAVQKALSGFSAPPQKTNQNNIEQISIPSSISNTEITMAYYAAQQTLYDLLVTDIKKTGLYAGLPWFFQFWARDELISLPEFSPEIQTRILEKYVRDMPHVTSLASSDELGWLFLRTYEHARKENVFHLPFFFLDPYAQNGVSITWMDSLPERNGRRIETMALALAMYKNAYRVTKDLVYKKREEELKRYVRNTLWNGLVLQDGVDDATIRPNIFMAAYIYPDLLNKDEWLRCFDTALAALWLPWGGLTTIDKHDHRFVRTHTGENPVSYHNGDSWFFLNNMAALVMHRLDAHMFRTYIDAIVSASANEILWHGIVGRPAEISSAESLRSEGCWMQAWSAALYMELINELTCTAIG
ncbi:MAG: amylo-alpha-1,6-glucosidase [bacterium]